MSATFPAKERSLHFQRAVLFLSFSRIGSQVLTFLGLDPIRIPKNLKFGSSILQVKKFEATSGKCLLKLIPINLLSRKLSFNPDTYSNSLNIALMLHKFFHPPPPINSISSANCIISTMRPSSTINPSKSSLSVAFEIKSINPSATNTKRKEDNGSPLLGPLL